MNTPYWWSSFDFIFCQSLKILDAQPLSDTIKDGKNKNKTKENKKQKKKKKKKKGTRILTNFP